LKWLRKSTKNTSIFGAIAEIRTRDHPNMDENLILGAMEAYDEVDLSSK
jgi:hypothetical protein